MPRRSTVANVYSTSNEANQAGRERRRQPVATSSERAAPAPARHAADTLPPPLRARVIWREKLARYQPGALDR